mmetsp:Transcript_17512/g.16735  ORF Transcript_17512/g.16735 Transcript_17512/m.16735 type:complete len:117 (+) Transcript_17512:126-476(+)
MLLPILPLSIILPTIFPDEDSMAILFVIFEAARVLCYLILILALRNTFSILINYLANAIHHSIIPITFVDVAIAPVELSIALEEVSYHVTFINGIICEQKFTLPFLLVELMISFKN